MLAAVDRLARRLKMTRSAFAHNALRDALAKHRVEALERKHRLGYQRCPVKKGEFDAASKGARKKVALRWKSTAINTRCNWHFFSHGRKSDSERAT